MALTTYSTVLQTLITIQLASKTMGQFPMPFPFPGMSQPVPPVSQGIFPIAPPMIPPPGIHYPLHQKLPVVVMPYYSKNGEKSKPTRSTSERRRRLKNKLLRERERESGSSDLDSAESASSDVETRRSSKSRKGRRQVLTPMVSYVTKDGYVVYQKKIKRDKAMDWLEMGKGHNKKDSEEENDSGELKRPNSVRRKKHRKHSH